VSLRFPDSDARSPAVRLDCVLLRSSLQAAARSGAHRGGRAPAALAGLRGAEAAAAPASRLTMAALVVWFG